MKWLASLAAAASMAGAAGQASGTPPTTVGRAPNAAPAVALLPYLTRMKSIASPISLERSRGELAVQLLAIIRTDEQKLAVAEILRFEKRRLDTLVPRAGRVKAPAALAEAHQGLVRSGRDTAKAASRVATRLQTLPDYEDVGFLIDKFDVDNALAADLQIHWRQEVIAQLRRAGLSVPLWLKNVGT